MDIWMMLAMVAVNAIALFIIYQFVKKMSKMNKIIFIAVSFAINYMLISLVCMLSAWGMEESVIEQSKTYLTYLFVPVNIILGIPFLASSYQKYKDKKLKPEILVKRAIAVGIFMIIVLVVEYFYFQSVFENIIDISENMQNNAIEDTNLQDDEAVTNEQEKDVRNEEQTNEITNTITNESVVPYVNKEK